MDTSLADRTVLIQGAAGAVGSEVVRRLAAAGARVGAVVRRPHQVAAVEQVLASAGVPRTRWLVSALEADDAEGASGLVKGVEDALGPIVSMISTVGAFTMGPFAQTTNDGLERLWQANVIAPLMLARAVVMPMQRRRSGTLVFTGARAVLDPPVSGMALYFASKSALHALALALAAELRPLGIGVSVLAPSVIDTADNRAAMPNADRRNWLATTTVAEQLLALAATPAESTLVVCP